MDPQIEALVRRILDALPRVPDVDAAIKAAIDELEVFFPGFSKTHAEDIRLARLEVERQFEAIEILHKRSVISKRTRWYFGPRPTDLADAAHGIGRSKGIYERAVSPACRF